MIQANFTVSPLTGSVLATEFTVTNLTTGSSVQQYTWDFGTGELIYHTVNPTKIYNYPGIYSINLTAVNFDGETSTYTRQISVELEHRDYIRFSQIPERFADPGKSTTVPFKVEVVSSNPNKSLIVDLFASNSKSIPYQFASDRWAQLTPTWKFLDKDQNFVTTLSVESIPIYKNNIIVAVSGTAEFYYVDSQSNGNPTQDCPILITATLQTSGFSNPQDSNIYPYDSHANNKTVRAGVIWQVNDLFPTLLKVTGNYIDEINPKQWSGIKIPVLVTAHSNRGQILPGSEDSISEVLFSYPKTNEIGKRSQVFLSCSNLLSSEFTVDEAPLYFQTTDNNNFNSSGYIFTTLTAITSISSTSIVAYTTANTDINYNQNTFSYPYGYAPNTSIWVSNPEQGTINKITLVPYTNNCNTIDYFKNNSILTDGYIKEVSVPIVLSENTFNYSMSGFAGIYSIAVDPRNYDIIACDAELDRIYKISNTGEILKVLELSAYADYSPYKKAFFTWRYELTNQQLTSNSFKLYGSTLISSNPNNYIVSVGGVIQPPDSYYVNSDTKELIFTTQSITLSTNVDVVQIFSPALPAEYISSITSWITLSSSAATTFSLTGTPSLSASSNYYIVSLDGILQTPSSYTINNIDNTITFAEPVQPNITVQVLYIPSLTTPAVWTNTFTTPTSVINLATNPDYLSNIDTEFLVNIGGVYQSTLSYTHDTLNQCLIFETPIPKNVPITITQINVPTKINIPTALTPAYVSIDKDYNFWVTLFNSVSVLKFDKDFNLLFGVTPGLVQYNDFNEFDGDFLIKPPVVEADMNNNCWVTYAHPLCSTLVHYSSSGNILNVINLPEYSVPVSLSINAQNNIWVGNTFNVLSAEGNIQLYDSTTYSLVEAVTGVPRPGYLAVDRNNNLWFTYSVRGIGHYNTITKDIYLWKTESIGEIHIEMIKGPSLPIDINELPAYLEDDYQLPPEDNPYREDEDFGGLAIDVYNRLWIIDSYNNNAWVFSSASPDFPNERLFKIIPNNTVGYYVNLKTGSTLLKEDNFYHYRSAQAAGDWTGNRWYQKYAKPLSISGSISGVSTSFEVTEFTNKHQIKRVNESFNAAEFYKSLALPEILYSNTILFDKFFPATVGTGFLSANEDPGQVTYERIANFVQNHSDVETCNIDQLLSLAEETAVPASDYAAIYPTDIRNMLDIGSVTRAKLWGIKDEVPILTQSIGTQYNTLTDNLTAGTKIILKSKFDSSLSLLAVPPLTSGELIYPVEQFGGYGLLEPITVNYFFYRFEPAYTGNYVENIIDWKSPYTTQSVTASTLEEWYGDEGSLETAFRYLLTKNLFLK